MHIAKALVLAGRASDDQPWPSARSVPRPLVPVANRPILFHHLDALREAGVLEATIAVERRAARAIRDAVGDGGEWGVRVGYVHCSSHLGLERALEMAHDVAGDEPILVQRAGALLRERIAPHIAAFAGDRIDAMALRLPASAPGEDADVIGGGWLLSERALSILQRRRPRDGGDPFACIRDEGGAVRALEVDGCELGQGGQDALLEANRRMLETIVGDTDRASVTRSCIEGTVVIHPTSRIEDSVIRGPAIIGPRAHVKHAYVGPYTSIGPGVTIEGAEVERSILFAGAELRHVETRIETSIIGERARVTRSFAVPKALRLAVGDGAEVALS
jgi:glucose-1-phosphate thymidylyltransferase